MANEETRRSVTPNGPLIDTLRKQKAWTLEQFALGTDLGMRTVQKVVASHPVSIETLEVIADKLEVAYESLLAGKTDHPVAQTAAVAPSTFHLTINLGNGAANAEKIAEAIAFLQKFLPDKKGLCILATGCGSLVVGVNRSPANEAALRDEKTRKAINEFGISDYIPGDEGPSPYVPGNFMSGHPLRPRMLDVLFGKEGYKRARDRYAAAGQAKVWEELSISQQRYYLIKYMREIADDMWRRHSKEFQPFVAKIGMPVSSANYEAMYKQLMKYLSDDFHKEHRAGPNCDKKNREERLCQLLQLSRYLSLLDCAQRLARLG